MRPWHDAGLILMVGTVEPRKRQLDVVKAFKALDLGRRSGLTLRIIGSLHPDVADEFRREIAGEEWIAYSGFASDQVINEAYDQARFSVFASDDEGFGLPIVESLAHGVPCLAANFGAMAEVAEGGGCVTVDVRNQAELTQGLALMTFDVRLYRRLLAEIGTREMRNWDDYAAEAWAVFTAQDRSDLTVAAGRVSQTLRSGSSCRFAEGELGPSVQLSVTLHAPKRPDALKVRGVAGLQVVYLGGEAGRWKKVPGPFLQTLADCDALYFESDAVYDAISSQLPGSAVDQLLPGWCEVLPPGETGPVLLDRLRTTAEEVARRNRIARRERNVRQAARSTLVPAREPLLTIVITTFNRASFVIRNVRWILEHIAGMNGAVTLLVVDNASTDATEPLMQEFEGARHFEYVRLSANTGMLGNINKCSTFIRARHVWLIGDDDYIIFDRIERLLDLLRSEPYVPVVVSNFSIYHRESIDEATTAASLVAESRPIATATRPTGIISIPEIATQNDNLFTAIYTLVFRSDILAAVVNYPFTGAPFRSLVESVPTTLHLLRDLGSTELAWIDEPLIAGNAHNSWRERRVAWHGFLNPLMFNLAVQVGVDRTMLRRWAEMHVALLREACDLFPDPKVIGEFSDIDRLCANRVLGTDLEGIIPAG